MNFELPIPEFTSCCLFTSTMVIDRLKTMTPKGQRSRKASAACCTNASRLLSCITANSLTAKQGLSVVTHLRNEAPVRAGPTPDESRVGTGLAPGPRRDAKGGNEHDGGSPGAGRRPAERARDLGEGRRAERQHRRAALEREPRRRLARR